MSSEDLSPSEEEQLARAGRPDPLFKRLTRDEAERVGLEATETQLQFSPRADLILTVPPGVNTDGTLFDFFRRVNVIEFKGESETLLCASTSKTKCVPA